VSGSSCFASESQMSLNLCYRPAAEITPIYNINIYDIVGIINMLVTCCLANWWIWFELTVGLLCLWCSCRSARSCTIVIGFAAASHWNFPGFEVFATAYDGNCLFAALAHQLHILGINKEPHKAATVRHEMVEFMQSDTQLAAHVAQGLSEGIIYFCFK